MIEQIRKFKKGGNSGPSLEEAKSAYDQAWEAASPVLRQNALALLNYAEKLRRSNQYSSIDDAQGMVDIYTEATNILNGNKSPMLSSRNTWGTRAVSNFYDYQKLYNSSSAPVGSFTSTSLPTYEDFKSDYFNILGMTDGDTFRDKVNRLIDSISTILTLAKNKKDAGILLLGYDQSLYDKTEAILDGLQALKADLANGSKTPREVLQSLLQLQVDLGFDLTKWDNYFGASDDLTEAETRLKALIDDELHKKYDPTSKAADWLETLGKKDYYFTEKDNQIYVWDPYYNKVTDSYIKPAGQAHPGKYLVIHDGRLHFGDIFDEGYVNGSETRKDDIAAILKAYKNKYDDKLGEGKFINLETNVGVEGDDILKALINKLKEDPDVKTATVVDVSNILGTGHKKMYAFVKNSDTLPKDKFGKLDFTKVELYTKNKNGNGYTTGYLSEMIRDKYVTEADINFLTDEGPRAMPRMYTYDTIFNNQDPVLDYTTYVGKRTADNAISLGTGLAATIVGGPIPGIATGLATKWAAKGMQNKIADNPALFVNLVVKALRNPNITISIPNADDMTGSLFLLSFGDIQAVINTAGLLVLSGKANINPNDFEFLKQAYLNFAIGSLDSQDAGIQWFKSGGIAKAENGTTIQSSNWLHLRGLKRSLSELHKAELDAKEAGYETLAAAEADKSTDLTTSDYMRFATMAADVSSIVASFVPGIGTGVAAGMGVVSMGTDLVADVLDPAVSRGQVLKNLGMNAAFAATGLIPGAKMHKVTANLIKWAPKIVTAVSALGIATDESTQKTLKKISEGKEGLTHADWRNLARVLSVVAGGTRMVKGGLDKAKLKNSITAADNVKLKGVKASDGSDFELPKETVKEINKALKKAKTPEDVEKIKTKYNDIPDEAFKLPEVNDKGKFKGTASLVETSKSSSAGAAVRDLWNKEAEVISKQAQENPGWFAFANKFGGGAYSGMLRAILSDPELAKANGFDAAKYLEYKGAYNPMYDYDGIRTKAGTIVLGKPLKTTGSTSTPKTETASVQNNTTPITLNPTIGNKRQGQVINLGESDLTASYSKNMRNRLTVKRLQTSKSTPASTNKGEALLSYLLHDQAVTIPLRIKVKALLRAKDLGITINNEIKYFKFLSRLKVSDSASYNLLVGGKTMSPKLTALVLSKYQQDFGFKLGGQLKYQHLRK